MEDFELEHSKAFKTLFWKEQGGGAMKQGGDGLDFHFRKIHLCWMSRRTGRAPWRWEAQLIAYCSSLGERWWYTMKPGWVECGKQGMWMWWPRNSSFQSGPSCVWKEALLIITSGQQAPTGTVPDKQGHTSVLAVERTETTSKDLEQAEENWIEIWIWKMGWRPIGLFSVGHSDEGWCLDYLMLFQILDKEKGAKDPVSPCKIRAKKHFCHLILLKILNAWSRSE